MIARRFRLTLVEGAHVMPFARMTLRPMHGLPMRHCWRVRSGSAGRLVVLRAKPVEPHHFGRRRFGLSGSAALSSLPPTSRGLRRACFCGARLCAGFGRARLRRRARRGPRGRGFAGSPACARLSRASARGRLLVRRRRRAFRLTVSNCSPNCTDGSKKPLIASNGTCSFSGHAVERQRHLEVRRRSPRDPRTGAAARWSSLPDTARAGAARCFTPGRARVERDVEMMLARQAAGLAPTSASTLPHHGAQRLLGQADRSGCGRRTSICACGT